MPVYYADFDLVAGANDGSTWAAAFYTEAAVENWFEATDAAGDILYVQGTTAW